MDQASLEELAAILIKNNPIGFEVDLLNISQALELAKVFEGMGFYVERKPYDTVLNVQA